MSPAQRVALLLAASVLAVPLIAKHEGYEPIGYRDPVGIPTACYGSTKNVVVGQRYAPEACMDRLANDVVSHALDVQHCITVEVPAPSLAAFQSFAFNVGADRFCGSTLVRKLNAGDLAGACRELDKWVYAGKRKLPGLVKRRAEERQYCERGLLRGPV